MASRGQRAGVPVSVLATCVLALSLLGVAGGLTLIPDMIPPTEVQSSNTPLTNSQFRYNLNTGAAFNISCTSAHTSGDFTVSFYKDGVVISEGDLEDTTLTEIVFLTTQKGIQLEFLNFQPVHDGAYHCFVNTSDTDEELSSDLYLYGSEFPPPSAVRVTPRYVVLDTSADLVLEARFRGNFYSHDWIYNEDDTTFLSGFTALFTHATVTNVGQTYTISNGSAFLEEGYYGPRVGPTLTSTPIRPTPENTVIVGSFVAPNAFVNGLSTAQVTAAAGDDVTFTCLARGFPETTITIQLSGVNASYTIGNQTLMTEATPTSSMEVTRTVTLHSVTVFDCGAAVTCEGNNMNSDGSTHADQAAATLQVQAPPSVGLNPSEPLLSLGDPLTLICTVGDCVGTFTFSWILDGSPVEASLVTENTTTSQLSVTSVTSADFGTYTCNVTNENGTGSAVAYVRESGSLEFTTDLTAPPMDSLNSSLSVLDGEDNRYNIEPNASFSLTCTAESPDNFTLSVSRMPSSATSGFTSDVADSMTTMPSTFVKTLTLTYSPFTPDLNGIYWCQADSSTTSNELESRRILLGTGPAAVTRVSDLYIELIPPNPLELQVTVAGAYESLTWSRGGVELAGNGSVRFTDFRQTLTVSSTSAGDAGEYTAAVSGSVSVTFQFQEFSAPQITVSAPTYVIQDDTLTVNCSGTSFPQSNVSLSLGDTPIMTSVPGEYDSTAESITYFTTHSTTAVHPSDEGNYTCSATITHGQPAVTEVFSDTTFVAVYVRPNVTLSPSVSGPVSVGDVVIFTCTASGGVPSEYSFRWFNGSVEVMSGDSVGITSDGSTSTLMLMVGPDDFVNYTCSVNNTFTEVSESNVLMEAFFPVPFITPESPDPVVLGSSITLTCGSYGIRPFNLSWSVNGILLARAEEVNTALSFTVGLVSTDNYTSYTCTSQNRHGVNSTSVTLEQAVPPVVTVVGDPTVTVTVNDSFSLQVTLSQYNLQPVTMEWERNGVSLSSGEKYQLSSDTSQLGDGSAELTVRFTESLVDNGTYTVTASNPAGNGSVNFEVFIMIAPVAAIFDSQKPTATISEGASGVLMCMATGVPAPTISWFFNGTLLNSDSVTLVITSSTNDTTALLSVTSTLNATSVMRESAFATITCTASNGVGANSSDSTQLIVLFAPNVTDISANQTVTSPAPVSFNCTVDSYPSSTIMWLHNGAEVQAVSPRVTISTVQMDNRTQENTLTLLNTTAEDTGTYTCSAVNDVGSDNMTTALQVLVAPEATILDSQKPTVTFSAGASGAVMCTATGVPAPTISWFRNGVLLSDDSVTLVITNFTNDSMSLFSVTSTLNVTSVMRDDAFMTITCTASNGVGANSSDSTQLIVLFPPIVIAISDKQVVTSPAPVSFNCTVDSYPSSTITWLHNGAEIQAAPPRVTISTVQVDNRTQESTLTFLNTTSEDTGTYTCSAVNDEGSGNMTTELQVLEPPEVNITEETFVVNETNPATLTCVATGIPQPNITWSVAPSFFTLVGGGGSMMVPIDSDGIDYTISSTTRVLGSQNIEVTSTLTVLLTDMNDSGVYTCEAMNSLGSVNDTAELIVQFAPEVINISQDQLTVSPYPVVMFCEATGYPRPTIAWFFNGAPVTVNENVTIATVVSPLENTTLGLGRVTSYLRLSVTRPSDAGVYECVSSNLLGSDTDRTNLTVHFRAEINVSTFQDLYVVNEGQDVTFSCSAFGVPAPTISWRRDGVEFSPSSDSRVVLHSEVTTQVDYMGPVYRTMRMLTFTNVMDSDTRNINGDMYQCVAVNTVGGSGSVEESEDVEDFTLFVQVAPTFTQDVVPTNVTFPDNLMLTCTATARPRPNISWYKDGAELRDGGQVSIASKNVSERVLESTLTVTSPFLDGIGSYTCTAENVVNTASSTAEVVIFSQPFIRGPPMDLTVNQSRQATFSCTAQGNPVSTISWTGHSTNFTTEVTPGANFTVLSVLTIDSAVRAVHEGLYTCSASNGVGPSPSSSATLTVQVPPTVQAVQGRIVGIQEMSVTLTFTISDASPEVQTENIQWTFRDLNGNNFNIPTNLLTTSFSNLMGVFSSDRLSLTLSGLTNDFEGTYTMTATNEAGSVSATVELVIEGPPRISTPPMSQRVVNDVDVTFDCYALAEPVHSLTWYFVSADGSNTTIGSVNGTEDMTTDSGKYQITDYTSRADYGRLLVRAVQFEDRGTYMCLAENRHGTDTASATLSVQVPPMFLSTSPQVDVNINSTDAVILNCSLRGYPLSDLLWRKDGTPFDPDGSDTNITTFRRQDPTDFYPFSSNTSNNFVPIPQEGLEYFEAVSELTLAPPLLRNDTANYTCEVVAVFVQNFTATSDNIPLFILEVPDAPFNVTITNNSQRSQVLSWVAPFDGNRPITQFVIYVSSSRQLNLTQIYPPLGGGRTRRQTTGDSTDPVPSVTLTDDLTTVIVSDIIPFVKYSYTVEAINELGRSDMSQPSLSVKTEAATPDFPPRGCVATAMSSTSFGVVWMPPDPPNGDIANYTIVYRPVEAVADYDPSTLEGNKTNYTDADTAVLVAVGLQSAVLYSIQLAATNQVGTSLFSQDLECTVLTQDDLPGVPQSVTVISPNSTSLLVTWEHPPAPDRNGVITNYSVIRQTGNKMNTIELPGNDTSLLLTDLMPFTVYNITVAGSTSAGQGEFTTPVTRRTRIDNPPTPEPPPQTSVDTSGLTATVPVVECSDRNGPISHYQIVVVSYSPGVSFDRSRPPNEVFGEDRYVPYKMATPDSDQLLVYVAAEFAANLFPESKMFTLGSGGPNDNDKYTNPTLQYSTAYTYFVICLPDTTPDSLNDPPAQRVTDYSLAGFSSFGSEFTTPPEPDDGNIAAIAGGIIVAIVLVVVIGIVIVIVVVIVIRRRKNKYDVGYQGTNGRGSVVPVFMSVDDEKETTFGRDEAQPKKEIRLPIALSDLPQALENLKRDDNRGYQVEYQSIKDNSPQHPVTNFKLQENKIKNRYGNIMCYDATRVVLQNVSDDVGADYINASHLSGYNREKEYIASQGPLPSTIGDFWRMVWEQDAATIVMLTQVIEGTKIKCQQYWPSAGEATYGSYVVKVLETSTYAQYTVRTIEYHPVEEPSKAKTVRQFHFTAWPDFGVPLNGGPLLKFLAQVRKHHSYTNAKPLLVHCSAGVGRTGTFIGLDVELQRASGEGVVDPYNFVLHMRDQRNLMVQTENQYIFLYETIMEGISHDYDEFPVTNLKQRLVQLHDVDQDGLSGAEKEFRNLVTTAKVDIRQFSEANADANKYKNRFMNFLPYNFSRVLLEQQPGIDGSDYINASYIDGYREKSAFIATQGPLPDTIEDFWRLVWEKNTACVVMLTQLVENSIEMCSQYWPASGEKKQCGKYLSVELTEERSYVDYVHRDFKITFTDEVMQASESRTVSQFHFLAWPERGAPQSGAGMIDLIDQVRRVQMKTSNNPIVVHCSNGTGRTGAFIGLSVALEHVRTECMVDVYGIVKNLRTQRPHMVQTLEQYIFCYSTIAEYVESMSSYDNFQ